MKRHFGLAAPVRVFGRAIRKTNRPELGAQPPAGPRIGANTHAGNVIQFRSPDSSSRDQVNLAAASRLGPFLPAESPLPQNKLLKALRHAKTFLELLYLGFFLALLVATYAAVIFVIGYSIFFAW
jgi:hypothetical protein